MSSHGKFNVGVITLTVIGLLSAAMFNFIIDPFLVFDVPRTQGINFAKPTLNTHGRLTKAIAIERQKPTTIILGSSRAALGINPDSIPAVDRRSVYNCALDGATAYEVLRYFEHALFNQPQLRRVILGIDYQMFNGGSKLPAEFIDARLCKSRVTQGDLVDTLLSLDACRASTQTLLANVRSPLVKTSYFLENGKRDEQCMLQTPDLVRWRSSAGADRSEPARYRYSQDRIEFLRRLVQICQTRGIELNLFVSPAHAVEWEQLRVDGSWEDFEAWKREIARIHAFWDFSGYNCITTEDLGPSMRNYIDASHYREGVGDLVLKKLLGNRAGAPSDFGVYCERLNVDSVLHSINLQRAQYVHSHPSWISVINALRNPDNASTVFRSTVTKHGRPMLAVGTK